MSYIAPVVVRNFDAVEIAGDHWTYYLNRKRLETAIALFELAPLQLHVSLAIAMREEYPSMTSVEVQKYLTAAQACFAWNIKV